MAMIMLLSLDVPKNDIWSEAIHRASFIRNCLLTKRYRDHKTPNREIHSKPPNLDNSQAFGC